MARAFLNMGPQGWATAALGVLVGAAVAFGGCGSKDSGLGVHGPGDETGGFHPDGGVGLDDTEPFDLEAGPAYAVLGVSPSHGPFAGGTRIELRGRGFSSRTKVRLGAIDVPAGDVIASDPNHVQVITPPGEVGEVDVQVSDELTGDKSILPAGFSYDAYYADPNVGATTGGTHVTLIGRGTHWISGTTVTIDGKACTEVAVDDDTHLRCLAPAGTPGTKSITVTTPDAVVSTARDAYTYADTGDGYRGGLAGETLPGELNVLALAYPNGDLVDSATVVVRGSDGTVQTKLTSGSGVASFPAPPAAPLTVTITKKCLQPTTFAGVEVRSVTAYLNPVLSVACIPPDGTPPPTGGRSRDAGVVSGELVWGNTIEFKRSPWKGIPELTKPSQRVVAYVFSAQNDNLQRFQLPDPTTAITPETAGTVGYNFQIVVLPGNVTVYAIAGIEDRPEAGPPSFDPYVYGIVRGVGVPTGKVVDRVFIQMTGAFSHSVLLDVPTGPGGAPISPRGPDRLRTTLNVDLGNGYMVLPYGYREDLLPLGGSLQFVGVPALSGALGSASYGIAVEDVSGGAGGAPLSSVLRYKTRIAGTPVKPGPFVPISGLASPSSSAAWNGHTIQLDLPPDVADLIMVAAGAGDGSTSWLVVAPGDARTIELPDFSSKPELGLPGGPLDIGVVAAKLPSPFIFGALSYAQLSRTRWTAYSYDTFTGFW